MKRKLFNLTMGALIVALVALLGYASFQLERWFNWHFAYGESVQDVMGPLAERIDQLEQRVRVLEEKSP